MMAVLLAASMVVSSTGFMALADEITFDDGFVVDEVVVEDAGFEVEEPVVEDEIFVEEPVVEEVGFFEEEPVVDNSDIFEAIAAEDAGLAETVIDNSELDVEHVYNGQAAELPTAKLQTLGDNVLWYHHGGNDVPEGSYYPNSAPPAASTWWTTTPLKLINVAQSTSSTTAYWAMVKNDDGTIVGTYSFKATIKPATATATLKDKEFTWGADMTGALATSDFNVTGLYGSDTATITSFTPAITWADVATPDGKTLGTADAGDYAIADSAFSDVVTVSSNTNYKFALSGGSVKIKKVDLKIEWPTTTTFDYDGEQKNVLSTTPTFDPTQIKSQNVKATYDGNKATDPGTYTASVKTITLGTDAEDISKNVNVLNPTLSWSIGKTKARVVVDPSAIKAYYGESKETVLARISKTNLTYETLNAQGTWVATDSDLVKATITGTPTFDSKYEQYVNAGTKWGVTYVDGLSSTTYEIVANTTKPTNEFTVLAAPVTVTANEVIVGIDAEPAVLTDGYKLADGKDSNKTIAGSADALARDIKDNRIKVTLTTTPEKPSAVGKYPINVKFEDTNKDDPATANFNFIEDTTITPAQTKTPGTNPTSVTITDPNKYTVTWGDFKLTFNDDEVGYDGAEHSIKMEPAVKDLPASITVYFAKQDWTDAQIESGTAPTVDPAWGFKANDPSTFKSKSVSSTNLPTRKEVGKSTIYYYVESTDYQKTGTGLSEWGSKTITIISAVKAVENQIDKATTKDASGKYDAEAVKAAREAYEALSADDKKKVATSKIRKLEDAEKAIKDDLDKLAAKEVEDKIDALPEADKATAADKAAADAAKEAYDKLTDDQKKLVPAEKVKKLEDVKKAADEAAAGGAKKVAEDIEALPTPSDVTLADKDAIEAAEKALEALSDEEKALVPVEDKEKLLACRRALDEAEEADKKAEEEAKAAADKIDAIKEAVPGKGKEATEAAREAYDALSMTARAKVPEDEVKALAQAEKCYEKDATFTSGEGIYRVLSNGDVTYLKPTHPENTYFQVPNDVKCPEGYAFKVVKVSTQAFKGCSNVKKIWMGKNIVTIGAYAFKGATNLTKLIVRTQDITVPSKVTNAFKAGGKDKGAKLNVQVWEKMISTYEPMFRNEGGLNAKAKITAIQ